VRKYVIENNGVPTRIDGQKVMTSRGMILVRKCNPGTENSGHRHREKLCRTESTRQWRTEGIVYYVTETHEEMTYRGE